MTDRPVHSTAHVATAVRNYERDEPRHVAVTVSLSRPRGRHSGRCARRRSPNSARTAALHFSAGRGSMLIGRQVGVYRLQALLGAGGMAEVYCARDTKLGRDVAIKILPHAFTADPDRLARFEREARVLAALNHPNIAQIYGLERSGGTPALVMELDFLDPYFERQRASGCDTGTRSRQ